MIEQVKIGAITYTVEAANDLHYTDGDSKKHGLNGEIKWATAKIRYDADLTEEVRMVTVLHEAIHGILNNAGVVGESETMVIALGYGLMALMRDNPALVEWVMKHD